MDQVESIEQLVACVRENARVCVTAGGTKPALSRGANISVAGLAGVVQYNPSEFTITVGAATKVSELNELLAEKQQYLPFDPPWVQAGATIGGTVAAGLSGSGRFRFGGVRDFLLGVKLVTGDGRCAELGSKVVKNAAGFDFPKLIVGSLGACGIATEFVLKVFPAPSACLTVSVDHDSLAEAVSNIARLAASQLDLACLDVDADNRLWARLAGQEESVAARAKRVQQFLGTPGNLYQGQEELAIWSSSAEFSWVRQGCVIVKTAVTPQRVLALASELSSVALRIFAGGHGAWIAWPESEPQETLDRILARHECAGLALTGAWPDPRIGKQRGAEFLRRLRMVLDPTDKFAVAQRRCA